MAMTRPDFELVARGIHVVVDRIDKAYAKPGLDARKGALIQMRRQGVFDSVEALCIAFERINYRFDKEKFLRACGF